MSIVVKSLARTCAIGLAITFAGQSAFAQTDIESAWQAVVDSHIPGPTTVELAEQATVDITADLVYIPRPAAAQYMNALGNVVDDAFLGLIMPVAQEINSFIVIDYIESGYIKDDDARDWDIDELFESLRAGTVAGNEWRESNGFAPIELTGWIERPAYNDERHQLIWSAGVKDAGVPPTDDDGVNYNTYVLGRYGYLSMNLITSAQHVENDKPMVNALLQATHFNDGNRYADFDSSTDSVAAYALAALVGGAAAKKLGLLGVMAAFLVKSWKVVALAVVGIGAAARRFMGRNNQA